MRILLTFVITAAFALAETTITDTVYKIDGSTPTNGTVFITLSDACVSGAGKFYGATTKTVQFTDGALSVDLHPNDDCTPANTTYAVAFQVDDGYWEETWDVSTSTPALTIGDVRTTVTITGVAVPLGSLTGGSTEEEMLYYDGSNFTTASLFWDETDLMLKLGGKTSSFPALQRNGTTIQAVLADSSAYTNFLATHYNANGAGIGYYFGAGTSAYPALKRNSTRIDVRLGDDSNYAYLYAGGYSVANVTASQQVGLQLYEQTTAKWFIGKGTTNIFQIYDNANTANRMSISTAGEIAFTPASKVTITGGLDLADGGAQPSCDSDHRGWFWVDEGAAGVADSVEACAKNSSNVYAWVAVATVP